MLRTSHGVAVIATVVMLAAGCSGAVHTLDSDLQQMHDQLEQGRYEVVYQELASQQQQAVDQEEFVAALKADPELVGDLVEMLDAALTNPDVEIRARITLEDGSEIVLALVDGKWTFETPITSFYGQATPQEALSSFIAAFKAGRWDVLATLVPSSYQTMDDEQALQQSWGDPSTSQQIERLVKVLETHVMDEITVQGNRATLVYPEGQVTFLREGGKWVILDLD